GAGEPGGPGPIGQQFAGLARLLGAHEGGPPLLHRYFEALGTVRSRFNAIHTQGDAGPGARKLMQQTLDADGSELSAALRLVDEQMLTGLEPGEREVLRPLLLRPLVQGFSALVGPTESELNRTWAAQVQQPFEEGIGRRYPYAPDADVEAAPGAAGGRRRPRRPAGQARGAPPAAPSGARRAAPTGRHGGAAARRGERPRAARRAAGAVRAPGRGGSLREGRHG